MKKIITLLLIIGLVSTSQAGSFNFFGKNIKGSGDLATETRDVDRFDRVKMVGSFDVYITVGEKQSIKITFDDNLLDNIETEVRGTTLLLNSRESYSTRKNCKIEITVKELEYVKLSGSGDIVVQNLDAEMFEYKLSGSGDLSAEGRVEELELSISGSGDIDTRDLIANDVFARISGSGDIKVYAKDSFDGRVSGSGDIYYYGNPEQVDRKISGSGSIRSKK